MLYYGGLHLLHAVAFALHSQWCGYNSIAEQGGCLTEGTLQAAGNVKSAAKDAQNRVGNPLQSAQQVRFGRPLYLA